MNTENEIWKDVGIAFYAVSNHGNVKNKSGQKLMTPCVVGSGHLQVALVCDGKRIFKYVHRLVAEHFIERVENKIIIDHIDRDKTNNHHSNLRWVSYSENALNREDRREDCPAVIKNRTNARNWRLANMDRIKEYRKNYSGTKNIKQSEKRQVSKESLGKSNIKTSP
jgi:hypothetical protein